MQTRWMIFSIFTGLILGTPSFVFAQDTRYYGGAEKDGDMVVMDDMAEEADGGAVEVGNKICPVSGENVYAMEGGPVQHEYKGKIYNFCCKMCLKDFDKDPEKYIKKLEESTGAEPGHDHQHGH